MDCRQRLDCVRVRVTLAGRRAEAAYRTPELGVTAGRWHRLFCFAAAADSATSVAQATADEGLLLLLHDYDRPGPGRTISTVRMRPARRSRLSSEWIRTRDVDGHVLRMEADWIGERHALAVTLTADRGTRSASDLQTGRIMPSAVFSATQLRFLRECADGPVDLDQHRLVGPVRALHWRVPLQVAGFPVAARLWSAPSRADRPGPTEVLDLSIRVEPAGAEIAQIAFEAALRDLGLDLDEAHDIEGMVTPATERAAVRLLFGC
ncbi:CYTH domain-containing protein [Frankia sp. AgKG'84/4]